MGRIRFFRKRQKKEDEMYVQMDNNRSRSLRITFRVNQSEKDQIEENAYKFKKNRSEYLREVSLKPPIPEVEEPNKDTEKMLIMLNRITHLINNIQVVGGGSSSGIERIKRAPSKFNPLKKGKVNEMKEVMKELKEAAKDITTYLTEHNDEGVKIKTEEELLSIQNAAIERSNERLKKELEPIELESLKPPE